MAAPRRMQPAPIPDNEIERLKALFKLETLFSVSEPEFDAITRTVARILDVPIASLTLVDGDQQWFKSRVGLDASHTPRNVSFCGHVVAMEAPLVVNDAFADPRFADNPLVTGDPKVRFYAGVPLRTEDGFVVGSLCGIDHQPRTLSVVQQELLESLAAQVMARFELRRRERLLREQESALSVYARFFEQSVELFCTLDEQFKLQRFNAAWTRTLGWHEAELRERSLASLIHPDDRAHSVALGERLLRESSSTASHEMRLLHRDGHHVPLSWTARAADGVMFCTARDLTEQKRRDAALQAQEQEISESAARLRAVFDAMVEGVVVQFQSGAIVEANRAAEAILGLTLDQLLGRTSLDPRWRCVREDGSPLPGEQHPAMLTLRTGQAIDDSLMGVHKPSGEFCWIAINSRPLHRPGEERAYAAVTTFHDVTEQRAAAERAARLARQERLVTTGTLAAGVGHEINNPLSYVLGNVEFAIEELQLIAGGAPSGRLAGLVEVLGEARQGADRIRNIVRGLLSLAREERTAKPIDVHVALEIALNMAMHELRPRAAVSLELPALPRVLAEESRLTQVFVNLLVNAAQAFERADPGRNQVRVTGERAGDWVAIRVSDNGPGIAPEVLPRIFDPFFTTKTVGEGTGLGLSISHSIVAALGGELRCETERGRGTSFVVRLPIARGEAPAEPAVSVPAARRPRVLLVDDDAAVSRVIARVLQRDYEVVAEQDARAAYARLEQGERFELILCDVNMALLSGQELYTRVQALAAELAQRFVFVIGGAVSPELRAFLDTVPDRCLDKPISTQGLRNVVRSVLEDGARTSAA